MVASATPRMRDAATLTVANLPSPKSLLALGSSAGDSGCRNDDGESGTAIAVAHCGHVLALKGRVGLWPNSPVRGESP